MIDEQLPGIHERRQSPRFRVVLPVTLDNTTGWTRDIGATGVFFTLFDQPARPPDAGAQIRLGLVLEHADPRGRLEVHCEGSVVRVEHTASAVGVAVQFDTYQFDPVTIATSPSRS